ncbi:MAG: CDGSH iron-sulfur domain-containing protein [Anaerolineae bacterium]|nr:CDGSH iron-sulfur domain-containing protein [Anaerolineae bacterium]
MTEAETGKPQKRIVVRPNGPYRVEGGIPLVRKTQVVSEYGEPLTWKTEGQIETEEPYFLCRCGHSQDKPFCDGMHKKVGFDGTETADTGNTADRQVIYPGGVNIVVKRDYSLCCESGYCATRETDIEKLTPQTGDTLIRSQVMAMIERCPSGSFAYSLEEGGEDIEPDYPQQIAVTTEITDEGPIQGPLWVTGNIPVERSDGKPLETRNRVTLCCCGLSKNKPLCDGAHRAAETERLRQQKGKQ